MGLDLIVEGCAKPGHEAEWRQRIEQAFAGREPTDADIARFQEISIPAFERLGAPRVGYDGAADAWIIEAQKAVSPEEKAAVLKEFHGHHVVRLAQSDGVPEYSHGGLYDGVDETSFRGSFLDACKDILSHKLLEEAWEHKLPEQAVAYGHALLAAADAAETAGGVEQHPAKRGFFSRLLGRKETAAEPFDEQLKIVRAAGRWFVFWGERGHAINAWS